MEGTSSPVRHCAEITLIVDSNNIACKIKDIGMREKEKYCNFTMLFKKINIKYI